MKDIKQTLVFDLGNTRVKIARFLHDELADVEHFSPDEFDEMLEFCSKYPTENKIAVSVRSEAYNELFREKTGNFLLINATTPNGLQSNYSTPLTLGMDRICNAVALQHKKGGVRVSIDIGTCIKFDCIDEMGLYLGGSISPGINIRYKSLNDYTAKLPLINEMSPQSLIGSSTSESISSGVINGVFAEILGFMDFYRNKYSNLTFFVTGGDAENFDFPLKSDIFVDKNLTLTGLYLIYKFNAE
ncbi:MAG: type III pantothenate kinase [Crocinitomicaceae bacterium]|nr:type III pantothenate kinase [Crocinitomicaceae bacterium]